MAKTAERTPRQSTRKKAKSKAKKQTSAVRKSVGAKRKPAKKPRAVLHRHICDVHTLPASRISRLTAGKSIDDLDLVDYAREAAEKLLKDQPSVVFTSGRRTVKGQADAMAPNVVKNRKWIEQTYAKSAERDALQKWVDDHPEARTAAAISKGLEAIMDKWSDDQRKNLSRHFSGQAFDVQPVTNGEAIKKAIRALPNLRKFLEEEGGLIIWHADFEEA